MTGRNKKVLEKSEGFTVYHYHTSCICDITKNDLRIIFQTRRIPDWYCMSLVKLWIEPLAVEVSEYERSSDLHRVETEGVRRQTSVALAVRCLPVGGPSMNALTVPLASAFPQDPVTPFTLIR